MKELCLPKGAEFFEDMIANKCYYVDKTSFIVKLLDQSSRMYVGGTPVILFNRPRRFGKTLNLTALRAFVDITHDYRDLFANLKVSRYPELCRIWQNQWPVLFVNFKDISADTIEEALPQLKEAASAALSDHLYILNSQKVPEYLRLYLNALLNDTLADNKVQFFMKRLIEALYFHYEKQVIVIIDEYDVPLSQVKASSDYQDMLKFMRSCFGCLKTNKKLCFAVLSGCLRLAGESLFSGFNNFECYNLLRSDFAEDFGFTHEEIKTLLKRYNADELFDEMRDLYDGYYIGGQHIFNPWSALSFLRAKREPDSMSSRNYWANTGSISDLEFFIQKFEIPLKANLETLFSGGSVEAEFNEDLTYGNLFSRPENFWTLMLSLGYLTVKEGSAHNGLLQFILPNREIKDILVSMVNSAYTNYMRTADTAALYKAFFEKDCDAVREQINSFIKISISYYDYDERFYHALTLGHFAGFNGTTFSNIEAGEGRPDLVVACKDEPTVLIIEIKAVHDKQKVDSALDAALAQIKEKKYALPYRSDNKKVIECALVYYKKECWAKFS